MVAETPRAGKTILRRAVLVAGHASLPGTRYRCFGRAAAAQGETTERQQAEDGGGRFRYGV